LNIPSLRKEGEKVANGTYTNALSNSGEEAPSVSGLCQPNLWQIALVVFAWAIISFIFYAWF